MESESIGIRSHIDAPVPGDFVDVADFSIRGWVAVGADNAQVAAVEVWAGERLLATTTEFHQRPDVIASLGLAKTARNGFTIPGFAAPDKAALAVKARLRDGSRTEIATIDPEAFKPSRSPLGILRGAHRVESIGLEIGAHRNPVPGISPFYTDTVANFAGSEGRADFLADGTALPLPDECLDYLCSSHVLEHLPDPLAGLFEWQRVLKPGGILYLVVPDQRYTFDVARKTTPVAHLLDDFRHRATAFTRVTEHIDDFVFNSDWSRLRPDCPKSEESAQRAEARAAYLDQLSKRQHIDIHFHTYTPDSLKALLKSAGLIGRGSSGFEDTCWAERYPAERGDGIGVLLVKKGRAQKRNVAATFELKHRAGDGKRLPLVCPVTLEPLTLHVEAGQSFLWSGAAGPRYGIVDDVPVLLPPSGASIVRRWGTPWRRHLTYWRGMIGSGAA